LPLDKKREKVKKVWKYREKWPKYDITKNNCETFATYLTKGRGFSVQASNTMSYGITTISCILFGTIYYIKYFKWIQQMANNILRRKTFIDTTNMTGIPQMHPNIKWTMIMSMLFQTT
jgi:hypothetical protein